MRLLGSVLLDEFSLKVLRTALEVVEAAQSRGIILRVLGAVAAYLHCSENESAIMFFRSVGRVDGGALFTDVDLIGYSKQRKQLVSLMRELGFDENRAINTLFGHKRMVFFRDGVKVDIFFDKLEFSHDVFFGNEPGKGRLELDYPTISLTDLLLEKLQIHQINKKDIIDVMAILMTHDVGDANGREVIHAGYIGRILSDDWGFWYDALENLRKIESFAGRFRDEGLITAEQHAMILQNIEKLRFAIEGSEKTKNWVKRAKTGTSKPWYREVEDLSI
jgi:hypothetical protein